MIDIAQDELMHHQGQSKNRALVQHTVRLMGAAWMALVLSACNTSSSDSVEAAYDQATDAFSGCIDVQLLDPKRRDEATQLLADASDLIEETLATRQQQLEALIELNSNYAATRAEFDALFDKRTQYTKAQQERLLVLTQRFQERLSIDERRACASERKHFAMATFALLRAY